MKGDGGFERPPTGLCMLTAGHMTPIGFNHQMLAEIGLGHLPEHQQDRLLRRMFEVLELRVGAILAGILTNRQAELFNDYIENNEDAATAMLHRELPEHAAVVRSELEFILSHVVQRLRERQQSEETT
jgi:hypothetical protein